MAWHQQNNIKRLDEDAPFEGINLILCLMVYLTAWPVMARPGSLIENAIFLQKKKITRKSYTITDKRRTVRPWIFVNFVAIFGHWMALVGYDGSHITVESKFKELEAVYAIITTGIFLNAKIVVCILNILFQYCSADCASFPACVRNAGLSVYVHVGALLLRQLQLQQQQQRQQQQQQQEQQ